MGFFPDYKLFPNIKGSKRQKFADCLNLFNVPHANETMVAEG